MLLDNGVEIHLLRKYVDDVLIVVDNFTPKTRLRDNKLVWTKETEAIDLASGKSPSQNTSEILRQIACKPNEFLDFTVEVSNGPTQKIACLDSEVWCGAPDQGAPWFKETGESHTEEPGRQW